MERFPVAQAKSKIPLALAPVGLRPKQAAAALGISVSYLYLLMSRGKITFRKVGAATIFLPTDLEAFASGLPTAEPDMKPTGASSARRRAKGRGRARTRREKPVPPSVPPPRPPSPAGHRPCRYLRRPATSSRS